MRVLLRITAVVALAWAVLLLAFKQPILAEALPSPVARALANGLGITNLVLAYVFWYAARAPLAHRGAVYGAILWSALKTGNDLLDLLVLLPPSLAPVSLADLVVSVALLVGLLEALPRLLATQRPG